MSLPLPLPLPLPVRPARRTHRPGTGAIGSPEDASAPRSDRPALDRVDRWQSARNILAVRLDNLGDLLMTTPALTALKTGHDRRLTLLTSRAGLAAANHLPCVDDGIAFDAPWVKGPTGDARDERRVVARLARRRFDAAVIFTVCTQSALPAALLLRLAGIPLRLAYARENPYALLSDRLPETDRIGPGMQHEVQRQLDLVGAVGFRHPEAAALGDSTGAPGAPAAGVVAGPRLLFVPRADEIEAVRRRLAAAGLGPDRPYLVVHPGSTAASRRYPPERFGAAAERIARATGAAIVLAGGPGDRLEAEAVAAQLSVPSLSFVDRLGLGELAALLGGARLCLCNNSGPAHLAAAMRTPVVVAYALTNPQHTPWGVPTRVLSHEVPCRDCLQSTCPEGHHLCLLGIDVDRMAAAALELWRQTEGGGSSATEAVSTRNLPPIRLP